MTIARRLAVGVVLLSCAIGLAGPASAEPLSGSYTRTIIDGGGLFKNGATDEETFTSCGPDCSHMQIVGNDGGHDFHLQGNNWVNSDNGYMCTFDKDSLQGTLDSPKGSHITFALTKNG
jgi:hypothetical protein